MAGSRKGERRGGKRKGTTPKPSTKPKVVEGERGKGGPLRRRKAPMRTEEYYRDITKVISASTAALVEPREVMLEAMRYFHDIASESLQEEQYWLDKLRECKDQSEFKLVAEGIAQARLSTREFYLLAVDCGFKCAPYVHAKLSSMEVTGANKGPIEVVGLLLQEIDAANRDRPSWAPPTLELEANE